MSAKCGACKRVFGGVSGFDAHRVGDSEHRKCVDPATVGLTEVDGVWRRDVGKPFGGGRLGGF